MVHHWRASDHLEQSFRAGQWFMFDRGNLVGVIQLGRINGRWGFRGLTPDDIEDDRRVLGYAWTLEQAADRLWAWYQRGRAGTEGAAQRGRAGTGGAPDRTRHSADSDRG